MRHKKLLVAAWAFFSVASEQTQGFGVGTGFALQWLARDSPGSGSAMHEQTHEGSF